MTIEQLDIEDWRANRKLVLGELNRIALSLENLDAKVGSDLTTMKVEVAMIKTKVAVYAAIAAIITSAVVSFLFSTLIKR